MIIAVIASFVIGYLLIVFEHPLKINKTASALLAGAASWGIYALLAPSNGIESHDVVHQLSHHLAPIAEIIFFLMGAMTIVELVDIHQGFKIITNRITTKNARVLLWIVAFVTFFLSAALDNLTTTIVMISLLRKLIHNKEQRLLFAGVVVIAANAGGAWSPIGDVTTTMLWIGGQISAVNIIKTLIVPSLVCMIVPVVALSFQLKGEVERAAYDTKEALKIEKVKGSGLMFGFGLGALLFVPVFKTVTHLPPYMGMLLGLAVVWIVSELIHVDKTEEEKKPYSAIHALQRIDVPSVLFFLGILIAISSLESLHVLENAAIFLNEKIGNLDVITSLIGALSAIVDNVPLVAASMGMYPLATATSTNPVYVEAYNFAIANPTLVTDGHFLFNNTMYFLQDAKMWEFMAYAAGTGGSMLIIGSAAGVAAMGMENISFIWYVKKITFYAAIGYVAGIFTYMAVYPLFSVH
jgi:Na+/H+ antiporter NhaD/arsenite permease-like protein